MSDMDDRDLWGDESEQFEDDREYEEDEVDYIVFASTSPHYHTATTLHHPAAGMCTINDTERGHMLGIHSEEAAQNMIKALQKAIDLGWFKK